MLINRFNNLKWEVLVLLILVNFLTITVETFSIILCYGYHWDPWHSDIVLIIQYVYKFYSNILYHWNPWCAKLFRCTKICSCTYCSSVWWLYTRVVSSSVWLFSFLKIDWSWLKWILEDICLKVESFRAL
jgi:hypothetical protein